MCPETGGLLIRRAYDGTAFRGGIVLGMKAVENEN